MVGEVFGGLVLFVVVFFTTLFVITVFVGFFALTEAEEAWGWSAAFTSGTRPVTKKAPTTNKLKNNRRMEITSLSL